MARGAVEKVKGVISVEADMYDHTVTVRYEDSETSLEEIIGALGEAGYTVGDPKLLETDS